MANDTPVTTIPTTNPKQPTKAPSHTTGNTGPFSRYKCESGLKPIGNGTPPKGKHVR